MSEKLRRDAALLSMSRFADQHNVSDRNWEEVRRPDRVEFIGTTDDGSKFGIGYLIDMEETERATA